MQKLLKNIRERLNQTQTELAAQLNVTFATVNRWENGRSVPNVLAQTRLYEHCKERGVPVYDMTLARIAQTVQSLRLPANRTVLFHGSKSGICGPIRPVSREQCDFGRGFYMGTDPTQALTLICDYDKSQFYVLSISLDDLNVLEVPPNIEWAMLVACHRGRMDHIAGTKFYARYRDMSKDKDLVIGSIANDRMFYVLDNFFIGTITDTALVNSLSALQLGRQYVAVSQKACDAVKIETEIPLSHLERLFLKDVAAANRAKGVALANDICKTYRREGLYFDEIIEQAAKGDLS